jgi:hypothetical protein
MRRQVGPLRRPRVCDQVLHDLRQLAGWKSFLEGAEMLLHLVEELISGIEETLHHLKQHLVRVGGSQP